MKPPEPIVFNGILWVGKHFKQFPTGDEFAVKRLLFTICYIDDTLKAAKGSLEEHKVILWKVLKILQSKNMAVKFEKSALSLETLNG